SREWKEEDAPWITVGRLTLPQQDTGSPRGRRIAETVERLSFDPWHALVEHRPLGDMLRARNVAYRLSTQERSTAPEPAGAVLCDGVRDRRRWPRPVEPPGPWVRALPAGRPEIIPVLPHLADLPALDPPSWRPLPAGGTARPIAIAVDVLHEDHSLRRAM